MTEILLVSVLILVVLIFILTELKYIKKYIQRNSLDLMTIYNVFGICRGLDKKIYNARKRDERLLREIHKSAKISEFSKNVSFGAITDMICETRKEIKEVSKQCTGIDNVSRENSNCDKELKQLILSTRKSIKEIKPILETSAKSLKDCTKILGLFEEIIKKSNTQDAERISKRNG